MKTILRRILSAFVVVAVLAGSASSAWAQMIALYGTVTEASGAYAGRFLPGAPTWLEIDMAPPLTDEVPGIPEIGIYSNRPFSLRVDGDLLSTAGWTGEVAVFCKVGGWMSGLTGDFQGPDNEEPAALSFALLGDTDAITSDRIIPGGIAIDSFLAREGSYDDSDGTFSWVFVAYRSDMAVPEPATFGVLGAAALCLVVCGRRWRLDRRVGGQIEGVHEAGAAE